MFASFSTAQIMHKVSIHCGYDMCHSYLKYHRKKSWYFRPITHSVVYCLTPPPMGTLLLFSPFLFISYIFSSSVHSSSSAINILTGHTSSESKVTAPLKHPWLSRPSHFIHREWRCWASWQLWPPCLAPERHLASSSTSAPTSSTSSSHAAVWEWGAVRNSNRPSGDHWGGRWLTRPSSNRPSRFNRSSRSAAKQHHNGQAGDIITVSTRTKLHHLLLECINRFVIRLAYGAHFLRQICFQSGWTLL